MPPFNDGAGTVLVQAALRTILDIAKVLRIDADNGELRVFYADLMAYCVLISDHLNRITRAGESLACDLADSIKRRLGAILISKGSVEDKLRELQARWGEVQPKDSTIKTQFINSVLVFGESHYQRVALIDFLSSWESDILSQYPQQRSAWTAEDFAPQKKIGEPSFLVWNSAQAVFRAMTACQNCGCTPEHEFGARLCLGTYRRSGVDDDTEVDFDMFLSATRDWQEVRVHTAKEKAIQFAMDGPAPPRQPRVQASRVQRLCVPIMNAKRMMTVELKVTRERLLWLPSKRSNRLVDLTKSPVSLHEFLQGGPRAFTDKTRRILAVLLSYAVLHLQDTPWLQPTWSSSDILFFHTKDSEIPLRPFLQTRLLRTESPELEADQAQAGDCDVEDEFDPDDFDPDDQMQHPCPTIVTLAIMLMEVYFVTPFDDIARQRDVEVASDASSLTRYIAASEIFEHCRDDMPDLFVYAVEKCLDRATWEDEEGTRLDSHALRSKIYEEVVLPLENDLRMGYSSISIEDLDRFAGELDFSNWDQAIRNQQAQSQDSSEHLVLEGQTPRMASPGTGYSSPSLSHGYPPTPLSLAHDCLSVDSHSTRRSAMTEISPRLAANAVGEADYKAARFFDDEAPRSGHSLEARANYSRWKMNCQAVYEQFITPYMGLSSKFPVTRQVKIAILDTGIDLNHPDIQARSENIKAKHNWLNEKSKNIVHDIGGHGTFVTSLLLDYAPDAEIYIAKIADKKPASPHLIAKAITHAVDVWKIDMISMSFGFPTRAIDGYDQLEDAIRHAYCENVLLFAAASNSGGQLGRAYPAREANVVCVHSTDARGNRSPFSPTPSPHEVNLATVGEAVDSAWPVHLCGGVEEGEDDVYSTVKSGTSYATPIMVGIAAFLLLYARLNLADSAHLLKRRSRMIALLQRIAQKGHGGSLRDGYYFVDVSLYNDSLFGKDKVFIDQTIEDLMNS